MREVLTTRTVAIAILAGALLPFVFMAMANLIGGLVLVPQIRLAQALGAASSDQIRSIVHPLNLVAWALLFGALFGLPLAALIHRSVLLHWLVFVVAVVLTELAIVSRGPFGAEGLLLELSLPDFWSMLAAVLVTWWIFTRRSVRRSHASATP